MLRLNKFQDSNWTRNGGGGGGGVIPPLPSSNSIHNFIIFVTLSASFCSFPNFKQLIKHSSEFCLNKKIMTMELGNDKDCSCI